MTGITTKDADSLAESASNHGILSGDKSCIINHIEETYCFAGDLDTDTMKVLHYWTKKALENIEARAQVKQPVNELHYELLPTWEGNGFALTDKYCNAWGTIKYQPADNEPGPWCVDMRCVGSPKGFQSLEAAKYFALAMAIENCN